MESAVLEEIEHGLLQGLDLLRHDVKRVELSPELLQEDREIVEDLIAAAINDAVKRIEESSRDALSGLTAGMKLPEGFKFPF